MIPNFMLRRLSAPGGVRLSKPQEMFEVAGTCSVCDKTVLRKPLLGVVQLDGRYENGSVYHYTCYDKRPASSMYITKKGQGEFVAGAWRPTTGRILVPRGNLGQEEYRFWVGYVDIHSNWAICRCCRTSTYNAGDRERHFQDEKYWLEGKSCSVRLVEAYKCMLMATICVVCHKQRFGNKKWGVPLCEQEDCERAWKFEMNRWVPLEAQLLLQKKKAVFVKQHTENNTAIIAIGEECKQTTRAWCSDCKMFKDLAGHEAIHTARQLSVATYDDDFAHRP